MSTKVACKLCGSADVKPIFSEATRGKQYTSYHCPDCDLYQTLGDVAPVSPDYIDLTADDLTDDHIYLQRAHKHPAFREWLSNVRKFDEAFGKGESRNVLDIGCGVGGFLDFAAENGLRTYGFDASKSQVDVAQRQHADVRNAITLQDYMQSLGQDMKFDFITMWDVFEHIREPFPLLEDVKRYLTPNGIFFISVPGGGPIPTRMKVQKLLKQQSAGLIPWEHVFYHTRRSLKIVFRKAGFQVVKISGVEPYIRTMSVHEGIRRVAHRLLKKTPYAFQFGAYARVKRQSGR
jgi:2-polyprenyl-3-methyl-5-hydroxy-6-metoxy-1,4-benzoquinol methylase